MTGEGEVTGGVRPNEYAYEYKKVVAIAGGVAKVVGPTRNPCDCFNRFTNRTLGLCFVVSPVRVEPPQAE